MNAFLKTSFPIAAVAAIFTAASTAQDQQDPKSKPEYCSIGKVVGAKVVMNPGAEAKREAERDGEPAKQPTAKIQDVLVDSENGKLDCAIVSFGGFAGIGDKTVALPFSALKWNEAHERFELSASEDRLKALPSFELGKARKDNLDEARNVAHSHWRAGARTEEASGPIGESKDVDRKEADRREAERKEAEKKEAGEVGKRVGENGREREKDIREQDPTTAGTKPEAKSITGTKFFSLPTRFVSASEIDDYPVYATAEKIGSISDLIVDNSKSAITLAVVKRGGALGIGGTELLVPFRAIKLCSSGDEKVLCMNVAANELETAVVYEKPKHGIVDAESAKRALASHTFPKKDDLKITDNR